MSSLWWKPLFALSKEITFTPDLAIVGSERLPKLLAARFAAGSPDIAFEIVSSDSAERLSYKRDAYLEYGARAVCCVYPKRRTIEVFSQGGGFREFRDGDSLEFPDVVPTFSLPLAEIFPAV